MDYQTFSQHQHLPSSLGGSYSISHPVSSAAPSHSPAHAQPAFSPPSQQHHAQSVYGGGVGGPVGGDPQARFASQQQQQQAFQQTAQYNGQAGGFPLASNMGGGNMSGSAMMQPGDVSQHQLQHARGIQQGQPSPSPYSSAPYSQSLQSPALSAAQKFAQQQSQFHKPAGSPTHNSPYATPQNQQSHQSPNLNANHSQQHQPQQQQQQQQHSMAAPQSISQSQTNVGTPQQVQTPVKAVPQSPGAQSNPEVQARDKERVSIMLEINSQLLQEICNLQTQGKGGYMGQAPPVKEDGKPDTDMKPASKEYLDCMRRLQANLSYLASHHERTKQPQLPVPPGPAIMFSFQNAPSTLNELYASLQALFPGWKGGQMKQSPGPQRTGGGAGAPQQQQNQQGQMQHQ